MSDALQPSDPGPGAAPALRASDADRERTVSLLRDAAADGRLDVDELDDRSSRAYAARTIAELHGLTTDLVPAGRSHLDRSAGLTVRADPSDAGTRNIVSVMGGHDRRGRWRVGARCLVLSIMGGADLDFSHAELAASDTTIRVVSIMGGAGLRFPSGIDVRVTRFALMGGHDVVLDPDPPPAGGPVIRVHLVSVMGGCEVRQGPRPRNRLQRRLERRERER